MSRRMREAEDVGQLVIIHLVLRVAPGMGGVQAGEDEGDRLVDDRRAASSARSGISATASAAAWLNRGSAAVE